jgi:hypothetical protein
VLLSTGGRRPSSASSSSPAGPAAVALVGSYELVMTVIRASRAPDDASSGAGVPDPLQKQAPELFADQLAAARVPLICAIRPRLHVGQPRAQRLRVCLAVGAAGRAECGPRCVSNLHEEASG